MGDQLRAPCDVEMMFFHRRRGDPRVVSKIPQLEISMRAIVLTLLIATSTYAAAADWSIARPVDKEDIVAAMRLQSDLGYDLTAISNSVRLQVSVFLQLAEWAKRDDTEQHPLRIDQDDYFEALLEVAGLRANEAPDFMTVPHGFHEDYLIDYRIQNVVESVQSGRPPQRALNVKAGWPAGPDAARKYTYIDTSTKPTVKVTHHQVNTYRILDFGEFIVYDDIEGVTGRAMSGVLGAIFSILGEARAIQTRFAISTDGLQISRTKAKKLITVTQTVTIYPNGSVLKGLPRARPDLVDLEKLLKQRISIDYVPLDGGPIPPSAQMTPNDASRMDTSGD
jgi:hypothetical protein